MASTPPKTDPRDDAFLREVDEEYRKDQVNALAARYGKPVIIGVLLALLAFGGFLFWRSEQAKARAEAGEAYLQAVQRLEGGGTTEAQAALQQLSQSKDAGYRALALLGQAAVAQRGGDDAKALGLYRAVAGDEALEGPFRDLARIKATRLEFDKLPPAQVIERLKPFAQPGGPWFAVAAEMTALAHLKANQPAQAGPLFLSVAGDLSAPQSVRARAEQMAAALGQDTTRLAAQLAARDAAPAAPAAPAVGG